jgi:hypothetical protein
MNHVGFMISPELTVVQDEVQGFDLKLSCSTAIAMHPTWCMGLTPQEDGI